MSRQVRGDTETRRDGDAGTRGHGEAERRGDGETAIKRANILKHWESARSKDRTQCFFAVSEFDQVIAMVFLSPRRRLSLSPSHSAPA
jgi:hypothetical protein